jgi:hypothetical protein
MLKLSAFALAIGLSFTGAVEAAPITGFGDPLTDPMLAGGMQEGFDAVSSGEYAVLTIGGVTFSGVGGNFSVKGDYNGNYNTTGGQSVFNDMDYLPSQFRFDFSTAVSAFAFNFGASDKSWLLEAFDAAGASLSSIIINPVLASNSGNYFGLSSGAPISFALLTMMSGHEKDDGDFVFLDRFTFKNANGDVPLPAALPLLASGIAGVMTMKQRKAKA